MRLDSAREPAVPASQALQLDDLRLYLENPAQYALRKRLGIRDNREEDPMELEDEPFYCPQPKDLELLEKIVHRRIADGNEGTREKCRRHFDGLYENLALRGLMPEGHFRSLDQDQLWERAQAMLDGLDKFFAGFDGDGGHVSVPGVVLGDGSGRSKLHRLRDVPVRRLPAVALRAAGRDLELHGELPCLFFSKADQRGATVVFMAGAFKPARLLPAFLFYAAAASGDSALGERLRAAPFTIHYVHKKYRKFETGNWAPFRLSREEARAYLERLLASMLTDTAFDLRPFELIAKRLAPQGRLPERGSGGAPDGGSLDFARILREELEAAEDAPDYSAPEIPESQILLDPRVPDDAEAKIRARLGPFFNFKPDPGHAG